MIMSEFISAVMKEFDGVVEKFPSLSSDDDELEAFGKAIRQSFLQFGSFPSTLCKAFLIYGCYRISGREYFTAVSQTFCLVIVSNVFGRFSLYTSR